MAHHVKILNIANVTHDVKRITVQKPKDYNFTPGQATEVAVDKDGYRDKKRPFTFTSLPSNHHLEFTIKIYPDHNGVTDEIGTLEEGDGLILDDAWGAIEYKGPGTFIAGGAGVTPFISILNHLRADQQISGNRLIFSNKTSDDVILEKSFRQMLGKDFVSTLTQEQKEGHEQGRIDKEFLKNHISDFSQNFYVCGPDAMVEDINKQLEELGANADALVFED